MNINDLVSGRLYKLKNKLDSSDYEKNEDLAMFLRIYQKKISVLTVSGEYRMVDIKNLEIPEKNYMELFNKEVIDNFSPIMTQFFKEYQKYDNIKYSSKNGFKSGRVELVKLNTLQKELKNLKLLPLISLAIDNYFEVYKDLGITFNSLEDLMIDFAYITEWEENFTQLRGFDFSSKTISPRKLKKYTHEALMLHHLYTNLFIKPNFKNIKAEWLDLLIDKFNKSATSLSINEGAIATLNLIKWKCLIENTVKNNEKNNNINENLTNNQHKRINFNL